MIVVPTAPWAHYVGDAAAWATAVLAGLNVRRTAPAIVDKLAHITQPSYFIALASGATIGAWLFGSLNLALSHSVAGALAGGIVGVELWKWRHGITASTGAAFVLPIALGIAVGRWGCLFAGLADRTYGTPTTLPWAVDLGDGVGRHPVQIYESLAMFAYAAAWLRWPAARGFHVFVIVYAVQRFWWEFLKPYPTLIGPLNLFHLLMLGLIAYGLVWRRRTV